MGRLTGMEACECGHSVEEHAPTAKHPGSSACSAAGCECIHYEPMEDEDGEE